MKPSRMVWSRCTAFAVIGALNVAPSDAMGFFGGANADNMPVGNMVAQPFGGSAAGLSMPPSGLGMLTPMQEAMVQMPAMQSEMQPSRVAQPLQFQQAGPFLQQALPQQQQFSQQAQTAAFLQQAAQFQQPMAPPPLQQAVQVRPPFPPPVEVVQQSQHMCPCNDTLAPDGLAPQAANVTAAMHQKTDSTVLDGCHISKVVLREDHSGEVGGLSMADMTAVYGGGGLGELNADQKNMIELAHVATTSLMCLDDRLADPAMGTPGGDLGEFALALSSYYQERDPTGKIRPTQETVTTLFKRYLETLPASRPVVLCTDERAISHLESVLPMENLDLSAPPMHAKEAGLIERLAEVESQGDSHFRLMLKSPEWYQFDKDLVPMVLKSFYSALWEQNEDPSSKWHESPKLQLKILTGQSNPQAFFEVSSSETCQGRGVAPKIRPRDGVRSILVSHLDGASARRAELATFFAKVASATPKKIDRDKLHARLDRHGWLALETTGSRIAAGLPFFTLDYV